MKGVRIHYHRRLFCLYCLKNKLRPSLTLSHHALGV